MDGWSHENGKLELHYHNENEDFQRHYTLKKDREEENKEEEKKQDANEIVNDPADDHALMRLVNKIREMGQGTLEDKLKRYGDLGGNINITQFHGMLKALDTVQSDYIRLDRVTRFFYMKDDQVKKQPVQTVLQNIYNRDCMREHSEDK